MNDEAHTVREQLTLEQLILATVGELASHLMNEVPGTTRSDFDREFWIPILQRPGSSKGAAMSKLQDEYQASTPQKTLDFPTLQISCGFCMDALFALQQGQRELAWSFLCEARYWCGVTRATRGIDQAKANTIKLTKQKTAQSGGNAVAEKNNILKNEVFKLLQTKISSGETWKSRNDASKMMFSVVNNFAKENKLRLLTLDTGPKTIRGWIREYSGSDACFAQPPSSKKLK